MGRLPRRKLGRGVYHVYNRSANNMWIFESDKLKDYFLELIEKYSEKYQLNIYHYTIMSNHFHLAIEGDIKEISSFISGLCSRYSIYFHANTKSGYGSIWQGRYKSVIVQKENYLNRLGRYIELNPVRANMVEISSLGNYKWSSAHYYLNGTFDKIIIPKSHPFFTEYSEYDEICQKNYADYLQIPYDDDILLFRSNSNQLGDESFLKSIIQTIGGRKKLTAGRPRKRKENNIACK